MNDPESGISVPTLAVVFPTRNNAREIREHLNQARRWIDLADEIIVVDSSDDDTPEICRSELPSRAKIITHPPGLYASWNAAIEMVSSDYLYISTIGDHIQPRLLAKMLRAIDSLSLDLIITPPELRDSKKATAWPIHHLIRDHQIDQLTVVEPQFMNLLNFVTLSQFGLSSLTGSFASNLVRSRLLQEHPFPTRYGGFGDTMWFAAFCNQIRMGILPESESTFTIHPSKHPTFTPRQLHECFIEAVSQQIEALNKEDQTHPYHHVARFHAVKMDLSELRQSKPRFHQDMLRKAALSMIKKYLKSLTAGKLAKLQLQLRNLLNAGRHDQAILTQEP